MRGPVLRPHKWKHIPKSAEKPRFLGQYKADCQKTLPFFGKYAKDFWSVLC